MDSEELIEFAADLVSTPSVLGTEAEMAVRVSTEMDRLGYDRVDVDEVGNVVGVWEGEWDGPTLLFDAHMDTVDVLPREGWSVDPFAGRVEEGRLWGRGAADMKGALAAMVHSVRATERVRLAGRLVVVGSVEEERIEGAALATVCDRERPDYVVIGEASDLELVRAGRGRAEIVLTTRGRPAHASTPQEGVHAVYRMMAVADELLALPPRRHPFVGEGVVCLTDIVSSPYPAHSVVPSACRATWERRLVPGETWGGVRSEVLGACDRAGAADTEIALARAELATWTGFEIDAEKWLPPWELAQDSEIVQRALERLTAEGIAGRTVAYGFCTNAAYSAGRAGIPTLGFGPGREEQAHVVDESLEIEDLLTACRGYAALAEALLAV